MPAALAAHAMSLLMMLRARAERGLPLRAATLLSAEKVTPIDAIACYR